MNFTGLAIERDRVTFVLLLLVVFAGWSSFRSMPQAEDPGFTIRTALVVTNWQGASPERIEKLVTDPLEKVIQEIPEVDYIQSQSKSGVSLVTVEIQERYKNMRPIFDNLRRKVDRAALDLPEGVRPPMVNDEFGDVFGTLVNMTGDGFSKVELKEFADDVREELLLLEDVSKVEIYGAQQERIFVEYSNARLAEIGLSPAQIQNVLAARNIVNSGGSFRTTDETIVLEPTGNFESVEDVAATLIPVPANGQLVHLRDVARIYRGTIDPAESVVHASGESALLLAISMTDGGNLVALTQEVRATLHQVESGLPIGIELDFLQVQGDVVAKKVSDFVGNLVQAIAIVLAVMLLSLGLRTGLVVASLIPMAIVMTFIFMPLVNVGLDQMSLAALIIALGLLVDNAIVMSESIMVRMGAGEPAKEAAIASAGELRTPLLVSSLTTAAAFLPIFLAESAVGEYTGALFKVVSLTLLCSWILALTMIPWLCVRFLKVPAEDKGDRFSGRLYTFYRDKLGWMVRHPVVTLLAVGLVFAGSLSLLRYVPVIFFPENDRPTLTAELSLPTGTPLARTEAVVTEIEDYLRRELLASPEGANPQPGVTNWTAFIGDGGPRFYLSYGPEQSNSAFGVLIINTSDRAFTDVAVDRLRAYCRGIPGLKATIAPLASGPPAGVPIQVRLSGADPDQLFELVDRVKQQLRSLEGPIDITDDWGARSKKFIVRIDDDRAQRAGVTHQDIALSLQTLFSGFETTQYREDEKIIPVILRSEEASRIDLQRFGSINVFSQSTGKSVPIQQVAEVEVAWQPSIIWRRDRRPTVQVNSELEPGYGVATVAPQLVAWLERESETWPLGYSWEIGGEDEASQEANASIGEKLPIAGLLIVFLLVAQFNSFRKPLIILLTIPLGLIGVIVGLLLLRSYFGFMTMLGVISLAGIVINNAIVLLDRIQLEIDEGATPADAVQSASLQRLRPILLTTFTTLGGMIPLYIGGGPLFESMAAAIIVGLLFATLLTLGVVPVLYSLIYRVDYSQASA